MFAENEYDGPNYSMNLSLEGIKVFEDLIKPRMSMDGHFIEEKHHLQWDKMHKSRLKDEEFEENLDKWHIEIKNPKFVMDSSEVIIDEHSDVEISAAWLHEKIRPSRWTNTDDEKAEADNYNGSDENHTINMDLSIQPEDYTSKINKDIKRREISEERPTSTPKISEESSKMKNRESETNFIDEVDFEIKDEIESVHNSLVGSIKLDVYSELSNSYPKLIHNPRDPKEISKNKNGKKPVRKRVAKEVAKHRLVEETKRNLRLPVIRSKAQPTTCVRKRTKLRSSGESSSAEPMDLSKRRDVVNKTILRVVRRFFSNKFKESLPHKYQNIIESQVK